MSNCLWNTAKNLGGLGVLIQQVNYILLMFLLYLFYWRLFYQVFSIFLRSHFSPYEMHVNWFELFVQSPFVNVIIFNFAQIENECKGRPFSQACQCLWLFLCQFSTSFVHIKSCMFFFCFFKTTTKRCVNMYIG